MLTLVTTLPEELGLEGIRWAVKCYADGLGRAYAPLFTMGLLPPLYSPEAGIVYREAPEHGGGWEDFSNPLVVLRRGWGDCNQLCTYLLAQLLAAGIPAETSIADWQETGSMHQQIRLPDGTIEDPSMKLGAPNQWPENFLYDL